MRRLLVPHLAVWVIGIVLLRVAVIPPELCDTPSAADVDASIAAAGGWVERNQGPDGRYAYGYLKDVDVVPAEYNLVRHAGAVFTMYQMAAAGYDGTFESAEAGLEWILDNLLVTEEWTAFAEPGRRASLGANGLFLVSLVERRQLTGDASYDELMRDVARFIVDLRQPDDSTLAWWDPSTGAPTPGEYGIFATGEAFYGLAKLNQVLPGEGWEEPALRIAHYLATERDSKEGEVARYPDHWAAYGMAELAIAGAALDDELIDYARALAGFFSVRIRVGSQRTGEGINLLTRWYPGPPSGVGTAGEGMAALWRLAAVDARLADMTPGMEDDLGCMAGMAVDRQWTAADAAALPRPGLVEGAWFYRDYSQIDDQQHTIAALLEVVPVLEAAETR